MNFKGYFLFFLVGELSRTLRSEEGTAVRRCGQLSIVMSLKFRLTVELVLWCR